MFAAVGRRWWAVPASDLVTVRREIDALQVGSQIVTMLSPLT